MQSQTSSRRPAIPLVAAAIALAGVATAAAPAKPFKVFMIASKASDHIATSMAAKPIMEQMGATENFTVDFTTDTSLINEANLAKYQVFFQMELGPMEISAGGEKAFENFINAKKGWVGIHGAGLIRPDYFPANVPYWQWYEDFFGGVRYVTHPALQTGALKFEDRNHPATVNMPATLQLKDEWYEFTASPRANVHVLATADEKTYTQVKPMGDHPLVWTNQKFARMIYIGVGHDVSDWSNATYIKLVHDAILWAAAPDSAATALPPMPPRPMARSGLAGKAGASLRFDQGVMRFDAGLSPSGTDAADAAAEAPAYPLLYDARGKNLPALP